MDTMTSDQVWARTHVTDCLRWRAGHDDRRRDQLWAFARARADLPTTVDAGDVADAAAALVCERIITRKPPPDDDCFELSDDQLLALGGVSHPLWAPR